MYLLRYRSRYFYFCCAAEHMGTCERRSRRYDWFAASAFCVVESFTFAHFRLWNCITTPSTVCDTPWESRGWCDTHMDTRFEQTIPKNKWHLMLSLISQTCKGGKHTVSGRSL